MAAVSELGPEDTSRNVVEIIFQSSWLRKQQAPVCRIDRVLKVQSGDRTVKRFQQYKESIKERASSDEGKKNARCVADGNELLRFHCTTFTCALGAGAGTALCRAPSTQCKLCGIIRDGFRYLVKYKFSSISEQVTYFFIRNRCTEYPSDINTTHQGRWRGEDCHDGNERACPRHGRGVVGWPAEEGDASVQGCRREGEEGH
jgi:hypothetical protein